MITYDGVLFTNGSSSGGVPTSTFTVGSAVAAGKLLVLLLGTQESGATAAATDSKGNTYVRHITSASGSMNSTILSALITTPLTASDTITITWGATGNRRTVAAATFSGVVLASPLDQTGSGSWAQAIPGNGSVSSGGSTRYGREVAVTGLAFNAGVGTPIFNTGPSGTSIADNVNSGGITPTSLWARYQILSSVGTYTNSFNAFMGAGVGTVATFRGIALPPQVIDYRN